MKKPKIHFNKSYTVWCENGHTAQQIAEKLVEGGVSTDVPICSICGGKLNEGGIN